MEKLLLTIAFFFAMSTTVYFFGKLLTWIAWKINPISFGRDFKITDKQIVFYCNTMIASIILWSIIFYCKL